MKRFLSIKLQFLVLLTATMFAPAIYAQHQSPTDLMKPTQKAAVQTADASHHRIDALPFIRTELFFGRNKPDGTEVSEQEFADFLSDVITPEFPDGLTVLDGIGQFREANGNIIREKAKVLILLYPHGTRRESSRKIERIRTAYKNRFQQQSVLRVDDTLPVKVSF